MMMRFMLSEPGRPRRHKERQARAQCTIWNCPSEWMCTCSRERYGPHVSRTGPSTQRVAGSIPGSLLFDLLPLSFGAAAGGSSGSVIEGLRSGRFTYVLFFKEK